MAELFQYSELAPANPETGMFWNKVSNGQVFVYFNDMFQPYTGIPDTEIFSNPISVFIGGINRSNNIYNKSVKISKKVTYQVDTMRFKMWDNEGDKMPIEGQSVTVFDYLTNKVEFGGEIATSSRTALVDGILKFEYNVTCVDYQKRLQRRQVVESYSSKTCKQIIVDIVANYAPEYSTNNVQDGITITKINFNYKNPADCIKELAGISGFEWFVDYAKDIHFFSPGTNPAPHELTEDATTGHYEKLIISRDKTQYKNRIIIQGGYYLSSVQTVLEQVVDGTQDKFNLVDEPWGEDTDIKVYVDVGAGYVLKTWKWENDETQTTDFTLNQSGKNCKNSNLATLLDTNIIKVIAKIKIPILTQDDDIDRQAEVGTIENNDGIYEYHMTNDQIETIEAAHDTGVAELRVGAPPIIKGSFATDQGDYEVGQELTINMPVGGYGNKKYVIQTIDTSNIGSTIRFYKIQFATKRENLIDILKRFNQNMTEVIIRPDETLNVLLKIASETVATSESAATLIERNPTTNPYVWSNDGGTTPNKFQWNFGQWAVLVLGILLNIGDKL